MSSVEADQPPSQPLIAVVDDDRDLRAVLDDLLVEAGYRTLLWDQGKGAHELIRQAQPDLVILDLWLEHPGAGGMVLGLLELDPATRHIPVIVCSGHRQLFGDQQTLLRDRGYILVEKPFAIDTMLEHIARLLEGRARQRAAD